MSIDGTIVAVMESWPLQLVVDTPAGRKQVALRADTVVTRGDAVADPHAITVGARVHVEGDASSPDGIVAASLHLT